MELTIVTILVILGGGYLLWKLYESKFLNQDDYYSFGLKEAQTIRNTLIDGEFEEVEQLIRKLNSDNLTQSLDFIGLTMDEEHLLEWLEKSKNFNNH